MIPVHVLLTSHINCAKTMIYLILYLLVSTLHMKFFGCIWPMQESYEKHFKTMWHITITYNNAYFTYQLFWVYMAHEAMISETLTNYVTSSNHLQKKYSYHLMLNLANSQKFLIQLVLHTSYIHMCTTSADMRILATVSCLPEQLI